MKKIARLAKILGSPQTLGIGPNLLSVRLSIGKTSFIIHDILSLLLKSIKALKNVNLEYSSFNFFEFQLSVRFFR
jgi:hypothetical protein